MVGRFDDDFVRADAVHAVEEPFAFPVQVSLDAQRGDFVFPGARTGRPLANTTMEAVLRRMGRRDVTVHGMRSAFRDWCAEATNYPREVAERALAHTLRDRTEAAYQRGDLFEKRRRLMEDWATFCSRTASAAGDVVPIRAAAL